MGRAPVTKTLSENSRSYHLLSSSLFGAAVIVAAPHGDAYYLVSGHRRHMAQLLAFALRDWAKEHSDTAITIEVVRTMLNTLVDSLGSLEKMIGSLLTKYGDEEISFVTFEGSQKAQILALQAANYGGEKPDMMGVAHSFRKAVEAGATSAEIARNVGQHMPYVRNHLALANIPPELAQRIAAGELPANLWRTILLPPLAAAAGTGWTAARPKMNLCLTAPGLAGYAVLPSRYYRRMTKTRRLCLFAASLRPTSPGTN